MFTVKKRILAPDTGEYRWGLLQTKAMEVRAGRAFSLFREAGLEPVLIKGWAAARLYPLGHFRLSTDTDLGVPADDFASAAALASSERATGLAIDLHRELRHLDTVNWEDLYRNSKLMPTESGDLRVLRDEDHLRVLCVHWLTDGGTNVERLWDIYYGIANRPSDFDWERFLDIVDARRRRWLVCAVGTAARYLALDLSGTPIEKDAVQLPTWYIDSLESEWSSATRTMPLETVARDRRAMISQIKRRLDPNPIAATVQMEGSFDAPTRFFYKIGNAFSRIMPTYRRISQNLRARSR